MGKNNGEKKKELLYKINLDVFSDETISYSCSKNIHPAEMIIRLSAVQSNLAMHMIQSTQKSKIDLIDPTKLPPSMRLKV